LANFRYSDIIFGRSNRFYHRPDQQETRKFRRPLRLVRFVRVEETARLEFMEPHGFSAPLLQKERIRNETDSESIRCRIACGIAHVVETFKLRAGRNYLDHTMVVTDPATISEPVTFGKF
jgi:hypothetical protein